MTGKLLGKGGGRGREGNHVRYVQRKEKEKDRSCPEHAYALPGRKNGKNRVLSPAENPLTELVCGRKKRRGSSDHPTSGVVGRVRTRLGIRQANLRTKNLIHRLWPGRRLNENKKEIP